MMAALWRSKAPLTLPWIEENNYKAFEVLNGAKLGLDGNVQI